MKLEDLIALVRALPAESKQRLLSVLSDEVAPQQVRDAAPAYGSPGLSRTDGMKAVTLVLPDELASEAQAAGLLAGENLETLIRKALQEQGVPPSDTRSGVRHLSVHNGRLVVDALPSEEPITSAEVHDALNKLDW
jgi:hypothetical protein